MPMGFVYVLFNPTITGMVKIGLSTDSSEARARALHTTGVADRFHVVYDELVSDCELVEYKMHTRFAELRHNSRREFFVMPNQHHRQSRWYEEGPLKAVSSGCWRFSAETKSVS